MLSVSDIYTTAPSEFKTKLQKKTYGTLQDLHIPFERVDTDEAITMEETLRWGFLNGTSKIAERKYYGYDRTDDGSLVINQEKAEIVKLIFESYCNCSSLGKI